MIYSLKIREKESSFIFDDIGVKSHRLDELRWLGGKVALWAKVNAVHALNQIEKSFSMEDPRDNFVCQGSANAYFQ